jgi:hypothetical protein
MEFQPDPAFPPRRPYRGWGGKRPGAGAPRGNLNALKHGAHSRQMRGLLHLLSTEPEFRRLLARLSRSAATARRRAAKQSSRDQSRKFAVGESGEDEVPCPF